MATGEILTGVQAHSAFYRLVGTETDDTELTLRGETPDQVANEFLTRGVRRAQRWMINMGYDGWRKRTGALTFTGSDDVDGGKKITLPNDYLRAYGSDRQSALREPDGKQWGQEINTEKDFRRGDLYYYRGDELWVTKDANFPATLFLEYHFVHAAWDASVTIDFPIDARPLIIAYAAELAKEDNWLPGGQEMKVGIVRALMSAKEEARDVARPSKTPRKFRRPKRFANRW